jgi:hypothetical protein
MGSAVKIRQARALNVRAVALPASKVAPATTSENVLAGDKDRSA